MHSILAALSASNSASPALQNLLSALPQDALTSLCTDVHISSFGRSDASVGGPGQHACQGTWRDTCIFASRHTAGGAGSTELSNFLNRQGFTTNQLQDQDGLRHCCKPPAWSKESCPKAVVYLYSSDPLASISSHYRRGHAHHQALKTASSPAHVGPAASFPPTLQDYCAQGQDLFGYEGHFRNWLAGADNYPILMLRYEEMFDAAVAGPLFQHLGQVKGLAPEQCEHLAMEWIARRQERSSQVSEACRASGMYAGLQQSMLELPPLHLVPAKSGGSWGA